MAASEPTNTAAQEQLENQLKELPFTLPKDIWLGFPMILYQGFWCLDMFFESVIAFQTQYQAHDTDIILASLPKTGTTWLKSLLFSIINREKLSDVSQHPLHSKNPHELVLHLETINDLPRSNSYLPELTEVPLPRLFATHLPYLSLPESIRTSKCRIVYVCRNPLDNFVSLWNFWLQFEKNKGSKPNLEMMMEEYVDKYCKGKFPHGPYEDHVLGYWKESLQSPHKVLFLEYEGLKKEPKAHLKRLAEFSGCPFSEEEEKRNVIDEILELCSLKSLKEMEVNKSGNFFGEVENKAFFRKGEVGDWINYLTPSMAKRIGEMREKLKKAGFSSSYYQINFEP